MSNTSLQIKKRSENSKKNEIWSFLNFFTTFSLFALDFLKKSDILMTMLKLISAGIVQR